MSFMKMLLGFAKGFLGDLKSASVEEIALILAKHIFLRAIRDFSAHNIIDAIKGDKDLWSGFGERNEWLQVGEQFSEQILDNIDRITPQLIMQYLREAPEPHKTQAEIIVNTDGGREWFVKQVELIKDKIKDYYRGVE